MKVGAAAEHGSIVTLPIQLSREDVESLGIELHEALPGASLVLTIDLHKLGERFKQVLKSKGKRTSIEGGAFEIRTAGARPVRGAEPVTRREGSR